MLLGHYGFELSFKTEEEKKLVWWYNVILKTNEILTKLVYLISYFTASEN